jgi:hypothetical protein
MAPTFTNLPPFDLGRFANRLLEGGITDRERQRRQSQAVGMQLWRLSPGVTTGQLWTTKEVGLLGTLPDPEAARRTGHPLHSVRMKRRALGVGRCPPVRR